MNFNKILFALLISLFFLPFSVKAATLYLNPASVISGPKDVFAVQIKIGMAEGECINAANIVLNFPSEVLEVKDFNSGESIFSLWIDKPSADNFSEINKEGKIIFSGGLPGGYCGKISGDPGDSNILGSVIFSPVNPVLFHKAGVDFDSETEVYLSDGQGTKADLETQGANVIIDEKITEEKNNWNKKIIEDKIPPESFTIEISSDKNLENGKYFIVFSTVDKQTGVDHYEILEVKPADFLKLEGRSGAWAWLKDKLGKKSIPIAYEKASSPYILKDQNLKSVIKVKAIDRAGNERVVEYQNEVLESAINKLEKSSTWFLAGVIALIFIFIGIIAVLIVKIKK